MSGEYISREAVSLEIGNVPPRERNYRKAMDIVDTFPAADVVEVRHGSWERAIGNPYPSCSECGCESLSKVDRPYCQFCGAKMDLKKPAKDTNVPTKPYDLLYEEGGPDA